MWEILVPTVMNDHPIRTVHHKQWDQRVRGIAGGLSIFPPLKGQYLGEGDELQEERVIPVRIVCNERKIEEIIRFTLSHYNQEVVLCYEISNNAILATRDQMEEREKRQIFYR
jgi:hypothetical protein